MKQPHAIGTLKLVDRSKIEVDKGRSQSYSKETHPELATLAELVADFPIERPLITDLGKRSDKMSHSLLSKGDIDTSICGDIQHPEKSVWYKLLLVVSLIGMLAIIGAYVALVSAVGIYIFSTMNTYSAAIGSDDTLQLVAQGFYILFSALFLLGMLKSILMKREKKALHQVNKEDEPVFFYYLETICESMSVPFPAKVYLDCDVDVSCRYQSIFSRSIVLHVGLPVVSGFSTKELAGILSHELSRFSTKNSFALVEYVRSLYLWMGKVSCHEDSLDRYIFNLNRKLKKNPFKLPILIIELFFKVPRWILHAMMWITHLVCQFAIYRIDYDSDFYEMQFAGNKKFEDIAYNMEVMSQTFSNTQAGFEVARKNKTLHDDLPGHIAATTIMLNEEKQQIAAQFKNKKSRITELHPAFKKRVAKAEEFHSPGTFNLEKPSTRLFLNLKQLKRQVSLEQYKLLFGSKGVSLDSLKQTDVELRDMNELSRDWVKLDKFFFGVVSFERIPVVDRKCSLNAKNWIQALRDLKKSIEYINIESASIVNFQYEYDQAISFKRKLICTRDILSHSKETHMSVNVMGKKVTHKNINKLLEEAEKRVEQREVKIAEFSDLCSARICCAIQLFNRKEFRAKVKKSECHRKNISHILHYLRIYDHIKLSLLRLKNTFMEAKTLIEANQNNYELQKNLSSNRVLLHKSLKKIELKLHEIPHPFSDSKKNISVMDYIGVAIPDPENFSELLYVAEEIYERSTSIYFKVLAQLTYIVEDVEECAGLEGPRVSSSSVDLDRTCG